MSWAPHWWNRRGVATSLQKEPGVVWGAWMCSVRGREFVKGAALLVPCTRMAPWLGLQLL